MAKALRIATVTLKAIDQHKSYSTKAKQQYSARHNKAAKKKKQDPEQRKKVNLQTDIVSFYS
jgi:hypothetical protein